MHDGKRMVLCQEELHVVIGAETESQPRIETVQPGVVPLHPYDAGGMVDDGGVSQVSRKSEATLLCGILEACRCVPFAVHLSGSDNVADLELHDVLEGRGTRIRERVEHLLPRRLESDLWIDYLRRETFRGDRGHKLEQSLTEILVGLGSCM